MSKPRAGDAATIETTPPSRLGPKLPPRFSSSVLSSPSSPAAEDEDARKETERDGLWDRRAEYVRRGLRGPLQQKLDKVDIPGPTEWLLHDAVASLRLRRTAQADAQLYVPRDLWQQPHARSDDNRRGSLGRPLEGMGIVRAIRKTMARTKFVGKLLRSMRIIYGDDVLPWGTWPVRLRNHDGQSFYDVGGDDPRGGSGSGGSPSAPHWAGGGCVGTSDLVGGVGGVSEDTIHDELLRQSWPSSPSSYPSFSSSAYAYASASASASCFPSSTGSPRHQDGRTQEASRESEDCHHRHHHEGTVKRLVPDKRGRWVEARTVAPRCSPVPACGGDSTVRAGPADGSSRPATAVAAAVAPAAPTTGAKRMVPGWYGGWVEVEETLEERTRGSNRLKSDRRAAVAAAARSGPEDRAPSLKRRVAPTTRTGKKRRTMESVDSISKEGVLEGGEGAGGGGGGEEPGGGEECASCGAVVSEGGECKYRSCGSGCGGFRSGGGGECWEGWTVSEPAKEAVRRVWGRARRRALDSFEPRHCARVHRPSMGARVRPAEAGRTNQREATGLGGAIGGAVGGRAAVAERAVGSTDGGEGSSASGENNGARDVTGSGAPAVGNGGGVRDRLDPELLPCLGRECEGIIDAALHVVLGEQLRRSTLPSTKTKPLTAASWEDVLRTMRSCAARARRDAQAAPDVDVPAAGGEGGGSEKDENPPNAAAASRGTAQGADGRKREAWGVGDASDGAVVVVSERLPALPLNEAVLTRAYNRLLLYLQEKKSWQM